MFPGSLVIAVTGLLFSGSRFQEPIVCIALMLRSWSCRADRLLFLVHVF
nr:MAG TPA: hypothetical protein [Caudoviricetes sp.]